MRTSDASPFDALLQQVRAAYTDRPTLRLTPSQAQRRFGLEPLAWVAVLDALVAENFLARTSDGLFVRRQPAMGSSERSTAAPGSRHAAGVSTLQGRVPLLSGAACASLARVIRFAGWLPRDTTRFRSLHDAVKALQAAGASPIALRDALYDVERAQEPLPGSATLALLRQSLVVLHDQLEASGLYGPVELPDD
jgi:hypothetical protein